MGLEKINEEKRNKLKLLGVGTISLIGASLLSKDAKALLFKDKDTLQDYLQIKDGIIDFKNNVLENAKFNIMNGHDHDGVNSKKVDHGDVTGLSNDNHTQYLLADGTRAITGDITGKDFINTRSGSITYTNNLVSSISKTGGRTLTISRDGNNNISSITDTTNTWTFTRDGNQTITSWSVTQ